MVQYLAEPAGGAWIELDELLRDYELGLVVIAGGDAGTGSRTVQWVHSSDLTDPAPFLTPRTVLLTTGEQFKGPLSSSTADAYVARLVAAGTTALGVAVGLRWDRIPPTLVEACERHSLPLIRVPYDTPFIAITRAAARLIESNVRAESVERAVAPRTVPASRLAESEEALRSAIVALLIEGRRELAAEIAAPYFARLPRGQVSVFALRAARGAVRPDPDNDVSANLDALGDGIAHGLRGGHLVVVCEASRVPAVRRLVKGHAAGLSERGSIDDVRELVDQAERALERASADNAPDKLVEYRPAMHSGVLQLMEESQEARRRAAGLLSPVRAHDERHGDAIEHSLETWLKHNGQLSPAADELGIHRHTLRARVRTAASLLQRDIDSPDTRSELWTALRIAGRASRRP